MADSKLNERGKLLSDPATYPLIFILGCSLGMFTGFGIYALSTYPDIRMSPEKRNKLFRDWMGRDFVQKHSDALHKRHKFEELYAHDNRHDE